MNHCYLEESVKGGSGAPFTTESTSWVLKIPLQLKASTLCDGPNASSGGSWWSPAVVGRGGDGSRVWGEKGLKSTFFMLLDVFITCKTHLANSCH